VNAHASSKSLLLLALLVGCGGGATGTDASGTPLTEGVLISGSIANLLGSGLVLQLNGSRDITPGPNNTNFFFANVPKKTTYTISVSAQPTNPWQTCTVSGGTGTATADNSSASLACTTNRYAVRGSITGLTASGLSLQLNGGTAQPIAAGSTAFAFADVASGTTVSITVASQPAGQTCAINAGDGRVAGSDLATAAITCGAAGFLLGGDYIFGGSTGQPTFRLNGGPAVSFGPGVDQPPFPTFTFPTALQTGATWTVVIATPPTNPGATCTLNNGKGKMASANVTSLQIQCFAYPTLDGVEGAYRTTLGGKPQYLTLWADGTYALATNLDATCPNNGIGIEYGAYRRSADGTFKARVGKQDTNGSCGLNDPAVPFGNAPNGRLLRAGANLTLAVPGDTLTVLTLTPIAPQAGSVVGAWVRADGNDGTFIVFHADGSYLSVESQVGVGLAILAGAERGCYTLGANTVTGVISASCNPDGLPSYDGNGRDGGLAGRGPIPFTLTGANTAVIDGVPLRRLN
jgi:hypothetical protein